MRYFAHALREEMARLEVSPYYLAEFTGLDQAFVRRLASGEKNPSLGTVVVLAMALVSDAQKFKANPMMAQVLSRLVSAAMADAVAGNRRRV
jgi:predicted transcriptional regulator